MLFIRIDIDILRSATIIPSETINKPQDDAGPQNRSSNATLTKYIQKVYTAWIQRGDICGQQPIHTSMSGNAHRCKRRTRPRAWHIRSISIELGYGQFAGVIESTRSWWVYGREHSQLVVYLYGEYNRKQIPAYATS